LFNETSASLNGLQLNLTQQLEGTITNINSDLQQIAQLNKQIIIVKGLGQQPNDLLDQMDGILNNLSSLVNVNIRTMQDGTTGVFLQGNALVNDTNYMQFKPIGGQKDGALEDVGLIQPGQIDPTNVTSLITSGQLGGILQARDQEVSSFKMQLDNFASSLINVVNQFE